MDLIIVGGGAFGLSTAYHALKRGYSVTLLDRLELPAMDGIFFQVFIVQPQRRI